MDWNTLLSVAIGGLIATLASIINNRFQSKERDKDRREERKEAQAQLATELKRSDVMVIEATIDKRLSLLDEILKRRTTGLWGASTPIA